MEPAGIVILIVSIIVAFIIVNILEQILMHILNASALFYSIKSKLIAVAIVTAFVFAGIGKVYFFITGRG